PFLELPGERALMLRHDNIYGHNKCNGGEVCVDYFLTENDTQAQCASSYMTWDNQNSKIPCSSSSSFAAIDISVGVTTYDVDTNVEDGKFESCFEFSGTARVTGYFAAFGV
ncbi:5264_t:CDS:2, partial [Rhizophagus irregularis]